MKLRFASKFLLALLLAFAGQAFATTYYVRTDGGTAAQCNGKADAAYKAGTTACAWAHPMIALPPGGTPKIAAGDTLQIGAGTYRMGYGSTDGLTNCASAYPWDCYMAKPPSGTSWATRTRIVGAGAGSCPNPTVKLVGVQRSYYLLDLRGVSNVEVSCLELTDGLACAEGLSGATCKRDAYPYGDWASNGIIGTGAGQVALTDLYIHGLANRGVISGALKGDWTLTRVRIIGNPWAGWDGDVGTNTSSNTGTVTMIGGRIAWNGCAVDAVDKPVQCWGQTAGGYGDGLGTAATGGKWVFDTMAFDHNTSDGLDLLYANGTGSITVRNSNFEANAGNQLKTKGPATITGSTIVGTCAYFNTAGLGNVDNCRAAGNALSIAATTGAAITLQGNKISGQGDCLLLTSGGDAAAKYVVDANTFTGGPDFTSSGDTVCGWYKDGGSATYAWTANTWASVKSGTAPANSGASPPPVEPPPTTEPPPVVTPPTCPPAVDNSAVIAALKAKIAELSALVGQVK